MKKQFIIGVVVVTSLVFGSVYADSTYVAAEPAGQGVEISPALVELNAERGNTYDITVKVTNVTTADLDYVVSVEDFNAKDETGSPQVILGSSLPPTVSIRSWVSSIDNFSLKTQEKNTIKFKLTVPADAEPGGHYGVLRFSGTDPQVSGSGVGLSASAGTLLLVRVAGDINESAEVASFFTASGGSQTGFFERAPITFVARIKNTGNIHIKPTGSIEIRNVFGGVVASVQMNETRGNVLPESIRRLEATYDSFMIGYFSATVTLGYGQNGQALVATTGFWVIPWKPVLVATVLLVGVVFAIRRLLQAYTKRVIRKYSKNEKDS